MYNYSFTRQAMLAIVFCSAALISIRVYSQNFTSKKSKEGIEILEKGKKVFFYQVQPKSLNGKYERAGYIHPLYSLDEKILTEDFPEDHPYHRGIFWTWHQIILDNKKIADGWTCENISWDVVKTQIKKDKGNISLHADVLWKSALVDNVQVPIVREHTKITVHQSTDQYRAIDFDIFLSALKDSLEIGGSEDFKGYGGFCLRLKLPNDIKFVSGDSSVSPKDSAIQAGPWMDFTGSFDDATSAKTGVTVFTGDNALSHQWILRKQKSMQNIVYPGSMPTALPEKGLRLRYRIIIHKNELSNVELENLYKHYVHDLQ